MALSACEVSSAAARRSITERSAPIPLTVRVCDQTRHMSAEAVLDAARLFQQATTDPAAPADLIAVVAPVDSTERTVVSSGFFLWTLGVIPWVTRDRRDVQVTFRRAAAGGEPCGPDATTGTIEPGAITVRSSGRMSTVRGWGALLLQPTPWWDGDEYDFEQPRMMRSRNMRLRTREALSRAIIDRAAEIRALAGR